MKKAVTLKENWEFRRLYNKGKSAVGPAMVVYCKKSKNEQNRLGVTVSTKLGGAVVRNRARRRLREVYRLNEAMFKPGYDIVVVARHKCITADFQKLTKAYLSLAEKAGILLDP
jgi:ribonuclease P protein component